MQELKDSELIKKAINNDMHAFRILVERYQSMAYSVAYKYVNNPHDSEDIVQEAFVRIWKNLSNFQTDKKFSTWLYRIVTNLALDNLKSKYKTVQKSTGSIESFNPIITDKNPSELLENQELWEIVHQASDRLTPKQKAVFVLKDLEGLDTAEVMNILSMNEGSVKSNLYYARNNMQPANFCL